MRGALSANALGPTRFRGRGQINLYVEASLAGHLGDLFYGLTAAVGALIARAVVRLSKSFISDMPLAVIAVVGFALTCGWESPSS
jgi:chromate transport protein ChrA